MQRRDHWQEVYSTRPVDRLGWYKPCLDTSLDWIRDLDLPREVPLIDVGCGASTLVDDLLEEGFTAITALDISEKALDVVQRRLGEKANLVEWIAADVTEVELGPSTYELWHDRAVFHFLTDASDRERYRHQLETALRPGGHLVTGMFSPDAPPRCSGLPVRRYALDDLVAELGAGFELVRHRHELHITPGGVEQAYLYCQFTKLG